MAIRLLISIVSLLAICSVGECLINGTLVSSITQYPFVAFLTIPMLKDATIKHCTASIINDETILTAKHCVCQTHFNRTGVHVHVGSDNINNEGKKYSVGQVITGNNNCAVDRNDITILKLKEKLTYNDRVQKIEIRYDKPSLGQEVIMLGYGWQTFEGGYDGRLRYASNNLKDCPSSMTDDIADANNMLCTFAKEDRVFSYIGDSGGPLVLKENGKYYLVGLNSGYDLGDDERKSCVVGKCFVAFTSTAFQKSFIEDNIK